MVTLDRALFDTNEALHLMGVLPMDRSITLSLLFYSFIMSLLIAPLFGRLLGYLFEKDKEHKYSLLGIVAVSIGIIYIIAGVFWVLIALALMGCMTIIYKYDRYRAIREIIDKIL